MTSQPIRTLQSPPLLTADGEVLEAPMPTVNDRASMTLIPAVPLAGLTPGSAEWQQNARYGAKQAVRAMQRTYIELGAYLSAIATSYVDDDPANPRVFESWGFSTFYDYALRELGLQARKADFLRRIYEVLYVKLEGLDPRVRAQIVDIDYSKVREMVTILTRENAREWVAAAQSLSYDQLTRAVADYRLRCMEAAQSYPAEVAAMRLDSAPSDGPGRRGNPGNAAQIAVGARVVRADESIAIATNPDAARSVPDEVADELIPTHRRSFLLYGQQEAIIKAAFDAAGALAGSDKPGHLLTLICMDYLATNGGVQVGSEQFANYLENLERLFQVHLIAVDRSGSGVRILAGQDHLEQLANDLDPDEDEEDEEEDDADAE
jgi:hypothetical protein